MDRLGTTSRWVAAARARESERPDRLFDDPLARRLAGAEGFAMLEQMAEASGGGENGYLAIRTRFLDDYILQEAADLRQIVILAAGMDARAFRLGWPPRTTVFEVEREQVLAVKEASLREAGAAPRCDRRPVSADLAGPWEPALIAAGFSPEAPAFFLVEGLTCYLLPEQAHSLLRRVSAIAAPGSKLGADIVGRSFLESPWTKMLLDRLEADGVGWHFGTDEPKQLLASFGWDATVTMPGEPQANWGRWPYPLPAPNLPQFPKSYFVRATRL